MTFKDHDLTAARRPRRAALRRDAAARAPTGDRVPGLHTVRITLDNPSQLNSYTTEMVKGVILGMRRASNDRARRGGGLHRRRHARLLHRRQHRGVRRVLRGTARGIPAVHAALQRHGERHPDVRQAGHLPRQRHAHRRRTGDRHGLRLLGRAGPGRVRAGRPAPRLGARRRQHRLPAALRRHRSGDGELHAVRALERLQGARGSASSRKVVPALKVERPLRAEPARRHRPLAGRRPDRLRRVQDRRGARRRPSTCSTRGADRPVAARSRGRRPRLQARQHDAGLPDQDDRERAQAQARALGSQQGEQPRLARPQHDDRGARRLPRVPRGQQGLPRGRLPAAAAAAGRRRRVVGRRADRRSPGARRTDERDDAKGDDRTADRPRFARCAARRPGRRRSASTRIHTGAASPRTGSGSSGNSLAPAGIDVARRPGRRDGRRARRVPLRRRPRLRVRLGAVRLDLRRRRRSRPGAPAASARALLAEACRRLARVGHRHACARWCGATTCRC